MANAASPADIQGDIETLLSGTNGRRGPSTPLFFVTADSKGVAETVLRNCKIKELAEGIPVSTDKRFRGRMLGPPSQIIFVHPNVRTNFSGRLLSFSKKQRMRLILKGNLFVNLGQRVLLEEVVVAVGEIGAVVAAAGFFAG